MNALFNAVDAIPFRPFLIELSSGTRVAVDHPDNVFILPSRQTVHPIEVFGPGPTYNALIWPEALVGIFHNGGNGNGHG